MSLFSISYEKLALLNPTACTNFPKVVQETYIEACSNPLILIDLSLASKDKAIKNLFLYKINKILNQTLLRYNLTGIKKISIFSQRIVNKHWDNRFKNIPFLEKEYIKEQKNLRSSIHIPILITFIVLSIIYQNNKDIVSTEPSKNNPIIIMITMLFVKLVKINTANKMICKEKLIQTLKEKIIVFSYHSKKNNLSFLKQNKELIKLLIHNEIE